MKVPESITQKKTKKNEIAWKIVNLDVNLHIDTVWTDKGETLEQIHKENLDFVIICWTQVSLYEIF